MSEGACPQQKLVFRGPEPHEVEGLRVEQRASQRINFLDEHAKRLIAALLVSFEKLRLFVLTDSDLKSPRQTLACLCVRKSSHNVHRPNSGAATTQGPARSVPSVEFASPRSMCRIPARHRVAPACLSLKIACSQSQLRLNTDEDMAITTYIRQNLYGVWGTPRPHSSRQYTRRRDESDEMNRINRVCDRMWLALGRREQRFSSAHS